MLDESSAKTHKLILLDKKRGFLFLNQAWISNMNHGSEN